MLTRAETGYEPAVRPTLAAVLAAIALTAGAAHGSTAALPLVLHDHTGIHLTDVVWTGSRLLYMENTTNVLWAPGHPPTTFATMPKVVEETRCELSPGTHGWPEGELFCHSPDNVVYRIDVAGRVFPFANLSDPETSDGAIAFDRLGTYGYRLLAATGASGAQVHGGTVYGIDAAGRVTKIGAYSSPQNGGAENMVQAPRGFGSASGELVLALDAGDRSGSIVALDAKGRSRVLAYLPDGANPIAVVPKTAGTGKLAVPRGLYLTDTFSTNVYRIPAAALRPYAGNLVVGTEVRGLFYSVKPHGRAFTTRRIAVTVPAPPTGQPLNLEGAAFVN